MQVTLLFLSQLILLLFQHQRNGITGLEDKFLPCCSATTKKERGLGTTAASPFSMQHDLFPSTVLAGVRLAFHCIVPLNSFCNLLAPLNVLMSSPEYCRELSKQGYFGPVCSHSCTSRWGQTEQQPKAFGGGFGI